jgi:hypothetical protein
LHTEHSSPFRSQPFFSDISCQRFKQLAWTNRCEPLQAHGEINFELFVSSSKQNRQNGAGEVLLFSLFFVIIV